MCQSEDHRGWFWDRIRKVLGSGESIKFWEDPWVNEVPLRVSFSVDCMGCLFKKMSLFLLFVISCVGSGFVIKSLSFMFNSWISCGYSEALGYN